MKNGENCKIAHYYKAESEAVCKLIEMVQFLL